VELDVAALGDLADARQRVAQVLALIVGGEDDDVHREESIYLRRGGASSGESRRLSGMGGTVSTPGAAHQPPEICLTLDLRLRLS